jgi:oligopeptidase A
MPFEPTDTVNPLLTRHSEIPFDTLRPDQVVPAVEKLLASTTAELENIKRASAPRTFNNTMRALDDLGVALDCAVGLVGHIENVATTPEWRAAYNHVLPVVSQFKSKIALDADLWAAIKEYSSSPEATALTGAKARFLKKTVDDFRRSGADLDDDSKSQLSAISTALSKVTNQFSQNVLDATNQFEFLATSLDQLKGLPESALALGKASADSKGVSGWRFTLQAPSFIPIMTYLEDRSLREHFYRAYNSRCTAGSLENVSLLYKILDLRQQKATLLGFKNFSDLILADRMAKSGDRAMQFVDELRGKVSHHFTREQGELSQFVTEEFGADRLPLEPWDVAFYAEKMRKALYDFDEEELRPYFALPRVMSGLFQIVERVFGITVQQTQNRPTWDPQVTTYSAFDSSTNELLGHFYADFYPRENKRGGAWMDVFNAGITDHRDPFPHIGLIAGNFSPPSDDKPALLTHDEVCTLFHEFGHLMHLLCSKSELRSQTMNGVAWDFIELPSQILENWCWERASLDLFASHIETKALLPEKLFEKLVRARTFRSASALMRQVGLSSTDLALHQAYSQAENGEILPFCREIMQKHSSVTLPTNFSMITTFTHLFSSPVAYASGYYSYQWAEVLDADAFSTFKRDGLMESSVGLRFRSTILSRGDTEAPDLLYKAFMGREPELSALLVRAGLTSPA